MYMYCDGLLGQNWNKELPIIGRPGELEKFSY